VDFLLALIQLFSLGVTAEALRRFNRRNWHNFAADSFHTKKLCSRFNRRSGDFAPTGAG